MANALIWLDHTNVPARVAPQVTLVNRMDVLQQQKLLQQQPKGNFQVTSSLFFMSSIIIIYVFRQQIMHSNQAKFRTIQSPALTTDDCAYKLSVLVLGIKISF